MTLYIRRGMTVCEEVEVRHGFAGGVRHDSLYEERDVRYRFFRMHITANGRYEIMGGIR